MVTSGKSPMLMVLFILLALCMCQVAMRPAWGLDDPGIPNSLAVSETQYSGPNITLPGFPGPVEQLAMVWHPTTMTAALPLIIFLHGRHETCYQGSTVRLEYPCIAGFQLIPSYRGYDYLAQSLASNGYIVVSISA